MEKIHYTDINLSTKIYTYKVEESYFIIKSWCPTAIKKEYNKIIVSELEALEFEFDIDKEGFLSIQGNFMGQKVNQFLTEKAARDWATSVIKQSKEDYEVKIKQIKEDYEIKLSEHIASKKNYTIK